MIIRFQRKIILISLFSILLVLGKFTESIAQATFCSNEPEITITMPAEPIMLSCDGTDVVFFFDNGPLDVDFYRLDQCNNIPLGGGCTGATQGSEIPVNGMSAGMTIPVSTSGDYRVFVQLSTTGAGFHSCTFTVGDSEPLSVDASSTPVSCSGGMDGEIILNFIDAGVSPYTYEWDRNNGASIGNGPLMNNTISGLSAGSYDITIYDSAGCNAITVEGIGGPSQPIELSVNTFQNVTCNGDGDGSVTLTPSTNSPSPYSYNWNNTTTGNSNVGNVSNTTINNLVGGVYEITVTDGNTCTATTSVTITEPDPLTASATGEMLLCNGDMDGDINLSVQGGNSGGYTYQWDNGAGTDPDPTGLEAGIYNIVITDSKGCTANTSAEITEPLVLTVNISEDTPASCDALDGVAIINIGGGVSNYMISWTGDSQTGTVGNNTITGLGAGMYNFVITDNNGCTTNEPFTLNSQSIFDGSASSINPDCYQSCDGTATVTLVPGTGTMPYTYAWSNGETTATITGLCEGNYSVTVTDLDNCKVFKTVSITDPAQLMTTITGENLLCSGGMTADIDLTPSGGTPNYSYEWSNGAISQDLSGLGAGTYTVTVTDSKGCETVTSEIISNPPQLTASTTPTEPETCYGNDGAFTFTVNNGVSNYDWVATETSGGGTFSDTNSPATGLAVGNYNVTITDGNGCEVTTTVVIGSNITPPPATDASLTACNDGIGEGEFMLSDASDLITDTLLYSVTYHTTQSVAENGMPELSEPYIGQQGDIVYARVYNSVNGCYSIVEVDLNLTSLILPEFVDFNMESSDVSNPITSCYDRQVLTATIPSPAMGHTYIWSTPGGDPVSGDCVAIELLGTTNSILLEVSVSGSATCGSTLTIPVNMGNTEVPAKALRLPGTNILFCNRNDFATYQWGQQDKNSLCNESIPGEFFQETAFASIDEDNYFYWVDVTDDAGCTARIYYAEDPFMRFWQDPIIDYGTLSMEVYPNPNNGDFTLDITGNEDRQLELHIYDALGQKVYTETIEKLTPIKTVNLSLQAVPQGLYFINIIGTSNLNISEKIIIR